jgi:hypothetical protein
VVEIDRDATKWEARFPFGTWKCRKEFATSRRRCKKEKEKKKKCMYKTGYQKPQKNPKGKKTKACTGPFPTPSKRKANVPSYIPSLEVAS